MLLCHAVLFLNFILAAAKVALTAGWKPPQIGPQLGGIYWIPLADLKVMNEVGSGRAPCIVFHLLHEPASYCVARLRADFKDALAASDFFREDSLLQTKREPIANLKRYYILPYEIYEVHNAGPNTLKLYNDRLTFMRHGSLKKFQDTVTMVDGWDAGQQQKAILGGVYWIRPDVLGITMTALAYIPCVVIHQVENKYVVVFISTKADLYPEYLVEEFFEIKLLKGLNYLTGLYIYPRKKYEVVGDPKKLQKWISEDLLKVQKKDLKRLVIESEMMDGWNLDGPLFGAVYWISPQFLGIADAKAGVYLPCVVLGHQRDNQYLVVRMSHIPLRGPAISPTFLLQGGDIHHLTNYYIYPSEHYEVQGDPKIMQKRVKGYTTQMDDHVANTLMATVNAIRNGQHMTH